MESNFLSKKKKVVFLYYYDNMDHFLIISYKSDIKIFYLHKYYKSK